MRGQCTGASISREKCGTLIRASERDAAASTKGAHVGTDWKVIEDVKSGREGMGK